MTYAEIEKRVQAMLGKFVDPKSGEGLELRILGIACNIKVAPESELTERLKAIMAKHRISEVPNTDKLVLTQAVRNAEAGVCGVCGIRVIKERN